MVEEKQELLALFNIDQAFREDIDDAVTHGRLVSNLAVLVAKELSMDDGFCENLADAGLLHDIGKLQLGQYLYGRRENALKIEEMKYVRQHPTLGYEFLCKYDILTEEFRKVVYHHHENYDGSGYPMNIKGDDIPLGARILRVCDVYSALISDRPYRKAFDKDTAMELMIDEAKNYDMKIFLALMRVVHSEDFEDMLLMLKNIQEK